MNDEGGEGQNINLFTPRLIVERMGLADGFTRDNGDKVSGYEVEMIVRKTLAMQNQYDDIPIQMLWKLKEEIGKMYKKVITDNAQTLWENVDKTLVGASINFVAGGKWSDRNNGVDDINTWAFRIRTFGDGKIIANGIRTSEWVPSEKEDLENQQNNLRVVKAQALWPNPAWENPPFGHQIARLEFEGKTNALQHIIMLLSADAYNVEVYRDQQLKPGGLGIYKLYPNASGESIRDEVIRRGK